MPDATVTTSKGPSPASAAAGPNRRTWPRVPADQLARIEIRLANGAEVRLMDLSRGGARLETDRRMLPNSTIAVKLVTADGSFLATGKVVRSRVIRLSQGGLGYDVAISFNEALHQFAELPAAETTAPADPLSGDGCCDPSPAIGAAHLEEWSESMIHVTAAVDGSSQELMDLLAQSRW